MYIPCIMYDVHVVGLRLISARGRELPLTVFLVGGVGFGGMVPCRERPELAHRNQMEQLKVKSSGLADLCQKRV